MISSIFGKTKPINYIILLGFLFAFYWAIHFFVFQKTYDPELLLVQLVVLGILLFSIFWVNFIVKRNKITGTNSFAMLFYTLLMVVFPEVLLDNNAILCSFFLLLATRRLLSIKSLKNIKHKIFDATLWIGTASLFYDWALLYLILVYVAISFYEAKNIRNWLVPLVGTFTIFMIATAVLLLSNNRDFLADHYVFSLEFDTAYFYDWGNSAKFLIYIFIVGLAGILTFLKLGKSGLGRIVTVRLIAISYGLGLLLTGLKASFDVFPILVTFFPAVVFITSYVEAIKKPKIREMVLILTILTPFVLLLSNLVIK